MHVTAQMKAKVERKLKETIARANEIYAHRPNYRKIKMPTVKYAKRGRTAGTADVRAEVIDLNAVLLMENGDDFINRTVVHEMAHIIDYILHPENFESGYDFDSFAAAGGYGNRFFRPRRAKRSVHGPTWKAIMRDMGADPSRCHTFDTMNASVKRGGQQKHAWKCNYCHSEMMLGPKRHQKQLVASKKGFTNYRLRSCKGHRDAGYTYVGIGGALVVPPMPKAADTTPPAPKDPTFNRTGALTGSKLEKCTVLYRENYGVARKVMIQVFVEEAGCTVAGAATYYAKIKKELGE